MSMEIKGLTLHKNEDYTTPEVLYKQLIDRIVLYHPSADVRMIEKAYCIAANAHKEQKRKSGEPYIIHPLCVANILAELELDKETIVAGLLHDVVEDTYMTCDDIRQEFGDEVALLVDGVTKLSKLSDKMDKVEIQAENLRKMFLAMAKDIRVILIKLADRLHNMRTLKYQSEKKQKEIAKETLDIYAPIAHRLGISKVKIELEDLCLKYLHPDIYYDLASKIDQTKDSREAFVQSIVDDVKIHLKDAKIEAKVEGRVKHFFSIYRKMEKRNKTLDNIYDLFAVRIIVENVKDCYASLGVIHEYYKPIPGRFKDYIAMPKSNMYQSIHTTLIAPSGQPFEIQIRTEDMHKTAEYGIAAHWKYKEGIKGTTKGNEEEKLSWLRQILEWQTDTSDNKEFMDFLKSDLDLYSENIYCFTPNGDVKNLLAGSTPIDFAYSIHTDVGNEAVGAIVNGKVVDLDYKIKNGDRVKIITDKNSNGPQFEWLNIAKTTQAKTKINQYFKNEYKEEHIEAGKNMLYEYLKDNGYEPEKLLEEKIAEPAIHKIGFGNVESALCAIGGGYIKVASVAAKLSDEYNKKDRIEKKHTRTLSDAVRMKSITFDNMDFQKGIVVNGIHDRAVHYSRCCNPVPQDEIVGFVTKGRGISIHRKDCVNVNNLTDEEKTRIIKATWEISEESTALGSYITEINLYATNRLGLLTDVSKVLTRENIDPTAMSSRIDKAGIATISMTFEIHRIEELNNLVNELKKIKDVIDIERTAG